MTTSRIQLALNVTDVKAAAEHYAKLFGVEPHKQRDGYANFAIADPPLKLVLIETSTGTTEAAGPLNHLGVEVVDTDQVAAWTERASEAGLATRTSEQEHCCHAVQDKVYVATADVPLGQWEVYTVLDDEPADGLADDRGVCCPTTADATADADTDGAPAGACCGTGR